MYHTELDQARVGCTERQPLRQVEFPLALPQIVLGINQPLMFALSMVAIAALVGTGL